MSCRPFCFLIAGLCLASPQLVSAQTTLSKKTVSLDVSNADFHAVVSLLERQTGITASVRDSETPFHPVFVHLDKASLPKALRTIAQSAGAKVVKNTDGSYLFESLDAVDPVLKPTSPQTSNPRIPLHRAGLAWHTLFIWHARAGDILRVMHWDKASPSRHLAGDLPIHPNLPDGVGRIISAFRDNTIHVEATSKGFQTIRQIVKILDIAPRSVMPTISVLYAACNELELKSIESSSLNSGFEIISSPTVTQNFAELVKFGHAPTPVKVLHGYKSQGPLEWSVPGYRLTCPRLNSDDSMTLIIEPLNRLFPEKETPSIHRGDVLAIREFNTPGVVLIKVVY